MTNHRRRSPLHRGAVAGRPAAVTRQRRSPAARVRAMVAALLLAALLLVAAVVLWVFDADWRWALVAAAALGLAAVFESTRSRK